MYLQQFIWLLGLAIPIACISWTFTKEEIFREPHEFCVRKSMRSKHWVLRKFFYVFTCEYCFSHYVSIFFIIITGFKLLMHNWAGYIIAGFSLVWIANIYMTLFAILRQILKKDKLTNEQLEEETEAK